MSWAESLRLLKRNVFDRDLKPDSHTSFVELHVKSPAFSNLNISVAPVILNK